MDVVNGWQNISETNTDKGVGVRLDYAATSAFTATYYGFLNGEAGGRTRIFNGVGAKVASGGTTLMGEFDVGSLEGADGGDDATWYGFTAIARRQLSSIVAVAGRFERFDDENQVNIATGLDDPFRGNGFSFGLDVTPAPRMMWRTEARGFLADAPVFANPDGPARKNGGFLVTSMAISF
jgi:hypothetical protein